MPYSQIIVLMLALLLISGAPLQSPLGLSVSMGLSISLFTLLTWTGLSLLVARRTNIYNYPYLSQRMEWLAVAPFSILLYCLGFKGIVGNVALFKWMPSLLDALCLGVYLLLVSISWAAVARALEERKGLHPVGYVIQRLRLLSPAIIPYLAISILFDLLKRAPGISGFLPQEEQEMVFMGLLFLAFLMFIPWLVKKLWNCFPLWSGPLRSGIETFLAGQGVKVREILVWPMSGETLCTAAVLGFLPRWRYILLTPCVIQHLTWGELEAVLSHEITHVKRHHILWYLIFLVVYAAVMNYALEAVWIWSMACKPLALLYLDIQDRFPLFASFLPVGAVGAMMVIYFRFIMGYFMRNFERQADLAVFNTQGHASHIISAFHKIAFLAGIDIYRKNWHHYGIAERMQFLAKAERDPSLIELHERRVARAKWIFFLAAGVILLCSILTPKEHLRHRIEENMLDVVVERSIDGAPEGARWYLIFSNYLIEKKRPRLAERILRRGLRLYPQDPELLNNLAWLLATSPSPSLEEVEEALKLAEKAVTLRPESHILDTYAEALWLSGQRERAVEMEKRALEKATGDRGYYLRQIKKFRSKIPRR